jgi:thymidylate synthase
MYHFKGLSADTVWRQALQRLRSTNSIQESRDQPTRELLHTAFTITDSRQRLIFARPINPAFAIAEVIWIMSGANDVSFLSFWNPRMKQFTDQDELILHGAYGYRLGSEPKLSEKAIHQLRHEYNVKEGRLDQIKAAYTTLQHTPYSRQVVMQIWNSKYDMPNPEPRSKDIPCNIMSHLMIRNNKLEWLQVMRSNDLIWGMPYNIIQFTTIQEIIAGWLGVEIGTYNHISDSLHVYERHWEEIETIGKDILLPLPINKADLRVSSYTEWEKLWARLVDGALQLTTFTKAADLLATSTNLADMPPAYFEWVSLLTAEALRRRGHTSEAADTIQKAGPFWGESWKKWAKAVTER